jgi:surfeit locus 1 family protein
MRLGSFEFRPGLGPSVAMLVVLPVLLWLGHWQFDRAVWKQGLVDTHAARALEPAVALATLAGDWPAAQYRRVRVSGHYDGGHQLLLDNQLHERHPGYAVLTPLRMDNGEWVLVNRGWVPASPDRSVLPEVPAPIGAVDLLAVVNLPPEKTFRLADVEEAYSGWPRVVQQVELEQFEALLGHELLPVLLALDPEDAHGFVRDWQAVYGVTPDKHRAYAMQWYTLALVLALIYVGVNTRRVDGNRTER